MPYDRVCKVLTTEHIISGKFGVIPEILGVINKKSNIMVNYFGRGREK